MLMTF